MAKAETTVTMDGNGRVTIPAAVREKLDVNDMDAGERIPVELTVRVEDE